MEHFMLRGTVIHGKKLGRTIGFPTANIDISKTPLSPGTYGFETTIDGKIYHGIGAHLDGTTAFEAHIFDFSGDLYGACLDVTLLTKIRDNKRFESFEKLKEQIESDKATMIEYIKNTLL